MIAQIVFAVVAGVVIWRGCDAFRERGLRVGFFQDHDRPLPKEIGMVVGCFLVLLGLGILAFGLFLAPRLFPDL